jgi:hypothetical protein
LEIMFADFFCLACHVDAHLGLFSKRCLSAIIKLRV